MDNKKFNIFALVLIVVMAIFSIYTGISTDDGKDGRDGMSAYELAVSSGEFSGTEFEYLQSLHGKDGSNVTLYDVYLAYIKEKNFSSDDYTYTKFILNFYPDELLDKDETTTAVQSATQSALRSTVDICYSFCLNNPILYVSDAVTSDGTEVYQIITSSSVYNKYASIGVSAGSGVIYEIVGTDTPDTSDDVAYIITNYHVVYASNYISDESKYRVYSNIETDFFGNITSEEMFTASFDDSKIKTSGNGAQYIEKTDVLEAPIETHFLDSYGIYLYGYQSAEYEISASFVGGSADNDIAVLKVERNKSSNNARLFEENYKAVDLGDSKKLDEGESVIAVGNPLLPNTKNVNDKSGAQVYVNGLKQSYVDALCLTSTEGVVSNISEYCEFDSLLGGDAINMRLIRVSAAINSGNSGGGLYDIEGKLVGIVNGKIASENYDNVGFAIPINIASRLADKIIGECDGTNTRTNVLKAEITSFGVKVKNGVSKYEYDSNSLSWVRKNNVIVEAVSTAASTAGLAVDDIITAVSFDADTTKYELTQSYDLNDILLLAKKGTTQKVVLYVTKGDATKTTIELSLQDAMYIVQI